MQVNSPAADLPTADHLEDGAQLWTTSSLNMETETIIITTTMLDPHPKFKTHRTILAMHWLRKVNLTFKNPNPSLAATPRNGLEDALDCGPDSNVFSALATLLCATVLAPDNLPAHLPSYSSTTLLLLPFSDNFVPTLVNSGTMDNFIDEFLVALASHLL
ncbi:hypothetical protein E4T56_gene13014 [Termitomyces sp. T112]|nr:hypothetical protein E4T56_gene13014 [Termitomyces sp. T112]